MSIDAAVADLLLRMVVPSELDLSLAVEREATSQADALSEQWRARLEQAAYEARRAAATVGSGAPAAIVGAEIVPVAE